MEKFEINEHNDLRAYYNDSSRINEITVPDGVKFISAYVFSGYNINHIILPDSVEYVDYATFHGSGLYTTATSYITYRGAKIHVCGYYHYVRDVIEMIRDKDYSCVLSHDLKYPVVMQIFFNEGDDVTTAYIKKNFKKFFVFLTENVILQNKLSCTYDVYNPLEYLEKLIKSGKFISRRNIETYVKIADEKECYSVFDMLNEYREENLT